MPQEHIGNRYRTQPLPIQGQALRKECRCRSQNRQVLSGFVPRRPMRRQSLDGEALRQMLQDALRMDSLRYLSSWTGMVSQTDFLRQPQIFRHSSMRPGCAEESKEATQIASPPDTASAVESRTGRRRCVAVYQSFHLHTEEETHRSEPRSPPCRTLCSSGTNRPDTFNIVQLPDVDKRPAPLKGHQSMVVSGLISCLQRVPLSDERF